MSAANKGIQNYRAQKIGRSGCLDIFVKKIWNINGRNLWKQPLSGTTVIKIYGLLSDIVISSDYSRPVGCRTLDGRDYEGNNHGLI
jgi:hypothetical protein